MTLVAIVSDVHGNLQALNAVLEDAHSAGVDHFWCLGDILGYGAKPLECLEILRDLDASIIRGNHEQAVIDGPVGFNPIAAAAITWTQEQIKSQGNTDSDPIGFICDLDQRIDMESATLVHGSPAHPIDEYLFREDTLEHLPPTRDFSPKLARCFRLIDRPCFVGHTHIPGVITPDMQGVSPDDCHGKYFTEGLASLINVGSTGQPRDGDVRASYALWDGKTVRFRRVAYDFEAAASDIFDIPDLPDDLGRRILEGW